MSGRRRDPRFRLSVPFDGSLLTLQDVIVEQRDEREVWVQSHVPGGPGDQLMLDLAEQEDKVLRVRVLECNPVIVDRDVRYRLRLAVEQA